MKVVLSNGGPLIAMRPADVPLWGGIDQLKFFEGKSSRASDYESICETEASVWKQVISVVSGSDFDIFMISVPLPTFIVDANGGHIYIAQIDTSEEGWSDGDLRASDFEVVTEWKSSGRISFKGGPIVFFDSAYVMSDLRREEVLIAELHQGEFLCEWSSQFWPGRARMHFIRLVKQES